MAVAYDLVIKNGRIVDGSGAPGFGGDVAIQGDRIAAIGKIDEPAHRTVEADGLVVAPGFIDHHTHMDGQIFWDPLASSSCYHGITSIITTGISLYPNDPTTMTQGVPIAITPAIAAKLCSGTAVAVGLFDSARVFTTIRHATCPISAAAIIVMAA